MAANLDEMHTITTPYSLEELACMVTLIHNFSEPLLANLPEGSRFRAVVEKVEADVEDAAQGEVQRLLGILGRSD